MSYVTWKVEHTPYVNENWDVAATSELPDVRNPLIKLGLGKTMDTFQFDILNIANKLDGKLKANDKITFYRGLNKDTLDSNDILFVGRIQDISEDLTGRHHILKIRGSSNSETLMNAIVFVDAQTKNLPQAVQQALVVLTGEAPNFVAEWDTNNPTLRTDGTPFPIIGQRFYYRPLRELLERYSTNVATGDGNYYWYVTVDNKLVWKQQDDNEKYEFDVYSDEFVSLKHGLDLQGIHNDIYLKGGQLPNGNQVSKRYTSWTSVNRHGRKVKLLVSRTTNVRELVREDFIKSYGREEQPTSYPDFTGGFVTHWVASISTSITVGADTITMTKGSPVSINLPSQERNEAMYNAVLREEIEARLLEEGKRYAESREFGKLQLQIAFRAGVKNWGIADQIQVNVPYITQDFPFLRVREIQFDTFTDTYYLEEDEGSI